MVDSSERTTLQAVATSAFFPQELQLGRGEQQHWRQAVEWRGTTRARFAVSPEKDAVAAPTAAQMKTMGEVTIRKRTAFV